MIAEAYLMDGMIKVPEKFKHINKKHLKIIALLDQGETDFSYEKKESINNKNPHAFFEQLKNRHFIVDSKINIDEIMLNMNN